MDQSFEPEITVLYCGRGLAKADYLPEGTRSAEGYRVRFVMVPCSSKVEVEYLVKLIENGADGAALVTCPPDECQFLLGSTRAAGRVKYARRLLEEAGIGGERLSSVQGFELSAAEFMNIAGERAAAVKSLGPNPMKVR